MKIVISLLLMLCMSELYANQYVYFMRIPSTATTSEALIAVKKAALKRRWSVTKQDKETLQIKLNHSDYKAVLKFIVSGRKLLYLDSSTYLTENIDEVDEDGEWKEKAAPVKWIRYIKNDARRLLEQMTLYRTEDTEIHSKEDTESKLEGLKKLFTRKLITESEYNAKRKQILSEY